MNGETNKTPERIGIIPGVVCAIFFGYASFILFYMMGMGFFKCYAVAATIGSISLFIPAMVVMLRHSIASVPSA